VRLRARGKGEHPIRAQCDATGLPVRVHGQAGVLVIVETGAAQFAVAEPEAERLDQMQTASGVRAQTDDVAGIGRDLGLEKHYLEHRHHPARLSDRAKQWLLIKDLFGSDNKQR
jgi:hypothetical protein